MITGMVNTPSTVSGPVSVAALLDLIRAAPKPPPEKVILAPSLAALEKAIPGMTVVADSSGWQTMTGIRVVFDRHAPRVMLVPAEFLKRPTL